MELLGEITPIADERAPAFLLTIDTNGDDLLEPAARLTAATLAITRPVQWVVSPGGSGAF